MRYLLKKLGLWGNSSNSGGDRSAREDNFLAGRGPDDVQGIMSELVFIRRWIQSCKNIPIEDEVSPIRKSNWLQIRGNLINYDNPEIDEVIDDMIARYLKMKHRKYSENFTQALYQAAAVLCDDEVMALLIYTGRANADDCIVELASKQPQCFIQNQADMTAKTTCLRLLARVCSAEALREAIAIVREHDLFVEGSQITSELIVKYLEKKSSKSDTKDFNRAFRQAVAGSRFDVMELLIHSGQVDVNMIIVTLAKQEKWQPMFKIVETNEGMSVASQKKLERREKCLTLLPQVISLETKQQLENIVGEKSIRPEFMAGSDQSGGKKSGDHLPVKGINPNEFYAAPLVASSATLDGRADHSMAKKEEEAFSSSKKDPDPVSSSLGFG